MNGLSVFRSEWRVLLLLSAGGLLTDTGFHRRAAGQGAPQPSSQAAPDSPPAPGRTPSAPDTADEKPASQNLLSASHLARDQWVFVSVQKDGRLEETWAVREVDGQSVLVCQGQPFGYLRTRKVFDNFQFSVEWKYPSDDNGNSGILVYTTGEDKVWPTSIQVQLHRPVAGSIFPSGDAKADNEIRDVRDAAKPVNQWNRCLITSVEGTLSVEINGRKVGEVTGCDPRKGAIALQSEGSEIHFRNIQVTEFGNRLPPTVSVPCAPIRHPCADPTAGRPFVVVRKEFLQPQWRRRRRYRERISNVVYRDRLAAHVDLRHVGDRVWVPVGTSPADAIPRWRDADGRCYGDDLSR